MKENIFFMSAMNINDLGQIRSYKETLKSLFLRDCESLNSIDGFAELVNSTRLNLFHCAVLTSINALAGLTNLTDIIIVWSDALENIDGLSRLADLTSLSLSSDSPLNLGEAIKAYYKAIEIDPEKIGLPWQNDTKRG